MGSVSKQYALKLLNLIDLTSLEGSDTSEKIERLCRDAKKYNTAAVCVYPAFVGEVAEALQNTSIKTASVAGGFPSSLIPLNLKLEEVKYAIAQGAQEIDAVLSQGVFLEGKYEIVLNEIKALKSTCGMNVHLKLILETGALKTLANIKLASELAIRGGVDFIKTSTGKINVSATPEAVEVMLYVIREEYEKSGKKTGIKIAGGISEVEDAKMYYDLVERVMGEEWLNKDLFRIGASRLAGKLAQIVF